MLAKFGIKTEPWLFMIWMIFGIIAGFRALYRITVKFQNEGKKDVNEDEGPDRT
jgi:F0F1-type ATP synthase assembly protein I